MTEAQLAELDQALTTALKSGTIEWAVNMRICDMLQANPSMAPIALRRLAGRLRKESPVPVLLALSLLEMLVKNNGLSTCRFVDDDLSSAMVALVKKRDSWRYGLGRNLHKSGMTSWLPDGLAIGEDERKMWSQASQKVLEMLQLWTDAFMLQESELHPIFEAYKKLRQEGYKFPRNNHGASAGLCLVHGAEESPAFLAGASSGAPRGSGAAEGEGTHNERAAPPPPPASASSASAPAAPASAHRGDQGGDAAEAARQLLDQMRSGRQDAELARRLRTARAEVAQVIENQAETEAADADGRLEVLFVILEELDEAIQVCDAAADATAGAAATSSSASAAVPPPPSEAPPDREQQEQYDLILARFLQERENEEFLHSGGWGQASHGGFAGDVAFGAAPRMVECLQCATVNQLAGPSSGSSSNLFMCYRCGLTQRVPMTEVPQPAQTVRAQLWEDRPAMHAPPARVICAGGAAPELLISAGGPEAAFSDPTDSEAAPSRGNAAVPRPDYAFASGSGLSQGLLGGGDRGSEKPLVGRAVKSIAKSVGAWVPASASSSGSRHARRLGDGTPADEYAELQGDEAVSSLVGGAPLTAKSASRTSKSKLPWKSGRGSGADASIGESLLERVQVTGDWELIRPPEGRPYWHNAATGTSQWEPPAVVRQNV